MLSELRMTRYARDIVQQYLQRPIRIVELPDRLRAMEQAERYRLPFWDALIVTAAQKGPSIGAMDGGFERRTADGRRRH